MKNLNQIAKILSNLTKNIEHAKYIGYGMIAIHDYRTMQAVTYQLSLRDIYDYTVTQRSIDNTYKVTVNYSE